MSKYSEHIFTLSACFYGIAGFNLIAVCVWIIVMSSSRINI